MEDPMGQHVDLNKNEIEDALRHLKDLQCRHGCPRCGSTVAGGGGAVGGPGAPCGAFERDL